MKTNVMKTALIAAICVVALCPIASAVQISITGTSQITGAGYVEGQSYTFTTEIGESFSGDFAGFDDGYWINYWYVGTASSDPALLSDIGGSMVSGNYVSADEQTLATIGTNWLHITIGMPANLQTPDGSAIYGIGPVEAGVNLEGISFAPLTSFADPAVYFAAYAGTYSAVGDYKVDNSALNSTFDVTSVTITPEPATMAILGLGGILIRRRKA
jgi:hypothetical protein